MVDFVNGEISRHDAVEPVLPRAFGGLVAGRGVVGVLIHGRPLVGAAEIVARREKGEERGETVSSLFAPDKGLIGRDEGVFEFAFFLIVVVGGSLSRIVDIHIGLTACHGRADADGSNDFGDMLFHVVVLIDG